MWHLDFLSKFFFLRFFFSSIFFFKFFFLLLFFRCRLRIFFEIFFFRNFFFLLLVFQIVRCRLIGVSTCGLGARHTLPSAIENLESGTQKKFEMWHLDFFRSFFFSTQIFFAFFSKFFFLIFFFQFFLLVFLIVQDSQMQVDRGVYLWHGSQTHPPQ